MLQHGFLQLVSGQIYQKLQAFRHTMYLIQKRLQLLVDLPADKLQKAMLQHTAKELSQEHA